VPARGAGAKLKVIRKDSFATTAWKNGGGVTREAIRVPEAGDPFSWRVSVAQIEKSGPFSDFAGYQRRMLLLQGHGVALTFGDGGRSELREVGDWMEFDGGISTHCDLIDGPCVDLNLMTAKSLRTEARLEQMRGSIMVTAGPGQTVLIFSLAAAVALAEEAGVGTRLEPWDLAVVAQETVRLETADSEAPLPPIAVFIATISQ
jgi:environmental stress-induced protein Ves